MDVYSYFVDARMKLQAIWYTPPEGFFVEIAFTTIFIGCKI